ncbi:MAG: esterase family protein [Oscillospiraceae bacterium]|nr:esterase family protein [Oscillospiraceae bacterium]
MEIRYFKHYSGHLGRDMEFKVYGHGGKPVLFIPCQSGRFFDFENFKMVDYWAKWIEEGRCTVYSADCIDDEAWAAQGADNRWRIENHERWYNYITEELVPYIKHLSGERNGFDQGILTFGCSMGAMHAANLFFRRPDLFDGVFAISGLYDSKMFFGDFMDELVYRNSPVNYLGNMPGDHYYIDMYNHRKMLIVCGQGDWEGPLLDSTRWLDTVCAQKGIRARFEYWGYDVAHDWPWWFKMVEHYVPQLLD